MNISSNDVKDIVAMLGRLVDVIHPKLENHNLNQEIWIDMISWENEARSRIDASESVLKITELTGSDSMKVVFVTQAYGTIRRGINALKILMDQGVFQSSDQIAIRDLIASSIELSQRINGLLLGHSELENQS